VPERFVAILRNLDEPSDEGSTLRTAPSASQGVNRDARMAVAVTKALAVRDAMFASLAGNRARGLGEALVLASDSRVSSRKSTTADIRVHGEYRRKTRHGFHVCRPLSLTTLR
jgi:hypothetical protein